MDFWWISIDVVPNQNTSQKIGFQYYKLTQYITYKATLAGIKVIQVSEARTSQKMLSERCTKDTTIVYLC
jgi:hypothetical protein